MNLYQFYQYMQCFKAMKDHLRFRQQANSNSVDNMSQVSRPNGSR